MEQLYSALINEWIQREIPWAGIAAVLAGTGSLLSGIAAYRMSRRNNEQKPENGNANN
jgi:hypothetical protein